MPEPAPAPMENPHLRPLKEETMWWLTDARVAASHDYTAVIVHSARFNEALRGVLRYETQLYERTRPVRLESAAQRVIVGALREFIRQPSPEWHVQPETHWTHARRFIVTLPKTLDEVWEWRGRPQTLTADAVFLWLKEHIVTICPYICPA